MRESDNPKETSQLLSGFDFEGFKYYMEMIEKQKSNIKKK